MTNINLGKYPATRYAYFQTCQDRLQFLLAVLEYFSRTQPSPFTEPQQFVQHPNDRLYPCVYAVSFRKEFETLSKKFNNMILPKLDCITTNLQSTLLDLETSVVSSPKNRKSWQSETVSEEKKIRIFLYKMFRKVRVIRPGRHLLHIFMFL